MSFEQNARVRVKTAPDKVGRLTDKEPRKTAGRKRYQVDFGNKLEYINENNLELVPEESDIYDLIESSHYGGVVNMRSSITHTRLTGRLADVIYSMEASFTEFFPYQFKPVLNFLDSPSQGILIADEVGLGKTIEAGLIWTELRARFDADRLLVLCPAVLREKWQDELAHRFGVRAEIYSAQELLNLLKRQRSGTVKGFAAIASIQGLRPPRGWDKEFGGRKSGAGELFRYLEVNEQAEPLFDCAIIDEAHYLRNPETQTHKLGEKIRAIAEYMVMLSATPIQLKNEDLFHLLSIIDAENFQYVEAFREILEANQPLVQLSGELRRKKMTGHELMQSLDQCLQHRLLQGNRQLEYMRDNPPAEEDLKKPEVRERYATRVERVNLLARVVNRTRKRDVHTNVVIRDPVAPEIIMNDMEQVFYQEVTNEVRRYCMERELSEGFILTVPQRQMCSSMPAAFRAWKSKQLGDPDNTMMFESGIATGEQNSQGSVGPLVGKLSAIVDGIATFEKLKQGDSKYEALLTKLREYWKQYPDKKVILFSYYRETLKYLHERLINDSIEPLLLMGGMKESKHSMIERFKRENRLKILLASEVASEGVDLQFSSFLINYDLPWNPMRVEQRIGRIDRIGQKENRIHIWNFFYANTLDDRIYNRLFDRLDIFRQALGDLEAVLGEKIQEMTSFLLSHDLTVEQEEEQIELTQLAIAREKREQEELEEEAAHLAAHGDYVLNKVKAAREMRRYIDGESLWIYVRDVLTGQFSGTELVRISNDPLTVEISLSTDARVEFQHYINETKNSVSTKLARGYTGERTRCVFSNKVDYATHEHEVINQYHSLVRFVSTRVETRDFHQLAATSLTTLDSTGAEKGTYLIVAQMWSTVGARNVEKLVFKGVKLEEGTQISNDDAERLLNAAVAKGEDWPAIKVCVDPEQVMTCYEEVMDMLDEEFQEHATMMKLENNDRVDYLVRTLKEKIESQIAKEQELIFRLTLEGKRKTLPARRGKIKKLEDQLEVRVPLFEKKRAISSEQENVTTVIIHVGK